MNALYDRVQNMSKLSWGYEDQCLKLTRYWCNVNMHFPWHVADNGTVFGGYDTNPDWRNGVPNDELCEWAIWQIAKEFTRSFLSNFDCDYTWREYAIDHRENYLVYQKHEVITDGTVFASSGKIDPWDDQPWLVQWDMNWDANGNSPLYSASKNLKRTAQCTQWGEIGPIAIRIIK